MGGGSCEDVWRMEGGRREGEGREGEGKRESEI